MVKAATLPRRSRYTRSTAIWAGLHAISVPEIGPMVSLDPLTV